MKKILLTILLAWGSNNITKAQVRPVKPKPLPTQKVKSLRTSTKTVRKKDSSIGKPKPTRPSNTIQVQANETILTINKAKDLFKSGYLLQTFRLLNQYKDSPQMDAESYHYLGECRRNIGGGIETNYKLAEEYLLKSLVLQDNKDVHLSLGQIYELGGFNLQRDSQKAIFHFQQAANQDVSFAKFELGRLYFQGLSDSLKNENKGIVLLEEAGIQDIPEAQWMLGSIYAKGYDSVPRDMTKAKFWFKKYKENKTIKQNIKL
ncbi:tetratricopeptide repeat protein [Arcicella aurantiaca]|uniref:tetratricopeptide repeat protein n=1 Tax=Arcicella aurantiaca TaxID=591202 RepID=UPI0011B1FFB6|nr:tetratricopeptide repeat protein [Arcicella aurantiaca]